MHYYICVWEWVRTILAMATVFDALQCIDIANDQCKYMLDDYGLVPNPVTTSKTDWRDGSADRSTKTKKQASQQQMDTVSVP